MNTPVTGDNTHTAKQLKISASACTPVVITPNNLALALARIQAKGEEAAAAAKEAAVDEDEEMKDEEPAVPAGPEPAPLPCSLELLPPTFTSLSMIITKKVTALLMMNRAKLRVINKLEQQETVPTSIRFQFELSGSCEVIGNSNFHNLMSLLAKCSLTVNKN
jgi:hypothetical protein